MATGDLSYQREGVHDPLLPTNASKVINAVVDGFTYDPGHSDLDDEQPIHVRMTLGDYRTAVWLKHALTAVKNSA